MDSLAHCLLKLLEGDGIAPFFAADLTDEFHPKKLCVVIADPIKLFLSKGVYNLLSADLAIPVPVDLIEGPLEIFLLKLDLEAHGSRHELLPIDHIVIEEVNAVEQFLDLLIVHVENFFHLTETRHQLLFVQLAI